MKRKGLPKEWQRRTLGDVGEYINGKAFKPSEWSETGRPIVRIQNLTETSKDFNYYDGEVDPKYLIKKGDVLISWSASLGVFLWNGGEAVLNQHIFKAIPNEKIVTREFFTYALRVVIEDMKRYTHGSTMKHIVKSDFDNTVIPIPPLETQRKIVAILDKAEATQRLRAEADALMQQLVQSVYISIFGDPVSNPQGWDIVSLESVCKKITDGEHVTPKRTQSGIYLLSARNIKDHEIDLSDVDYIDQDEYNRISKRIIPQKGDVLISCSGSVGRVSQVTDDMKFQMVRSVALIRPDNQKLDSTYLEYTFDTNYLKAQIAQSVNQSSQANLFQNKIRKLRIPVPPMHLQKVFVDVAVRKGRITEKQRLNSTKTQTLYNSLLSKAFTGELVP